MKQETLRSELKSVQTVLDYLKCLDGVLVDTALYAYINAASIAVDYALSSVGQYDVCDDEERNADLTQSI